MERTFGLIREIISNSLTGLILDIIHVGSISIVGLPSKPIIDIDMIANESENQEKFSKLREIGYLHQGNLGIEGREAFNRESTALQLKLPNHYLYLCIPGSKSLEDHLYFKEYLK